MKSKTSITLSASILAELDAVIGKNGNRSKLIEKAIHEYLQKLIRDERDKREIQLINQHADQLNKEANDVLGYQVKL